MFLQGQVYNHRLRDVPKKARAAIQTCTRESFKLNFIQKTKKQTNQKKEVFVYNG